MREPSRALPAWAYGDPAEAVERSELEILGCKACGKEWPVLGKAQCTEPKNDRQKGVPWIGYRCRWFQLRG